MMIKYALLISSIFFATINSFGQKRQSDNYIILTVEDSYSKGFEGIKKYYWIIEVDSIKNFDNNFYPLFLSGFSNNILERCVSGMDIDPYIFTKADTVFDWGYQYWNEIDHLEKLILKNRKKVQKITREWTERNSKEFISFFITPVKGIFCSSPLAKTGEWRTGYKGNVFIPYSSFDIDLQFFKTQKFIDISGEDFLKTKFRIFP